VLDPDHEYDHLVLASTLPFLILPGVHHLEGWDEAIAQGAWGRPGRWVGEKLRQVLDLEHWAAWSESFAEFTTLLRDAVTTVGPDNILLLGGDVHCSYIAAAELDGLDHPGTSIRQLTMSPFRNDIERPAKLAFRLLNRRGLNGAMHGLAKLARVPEAGLSWVVEHGVWFDNGVISVELDESCAVAVDHAIVEDGVQRLRRTVRIDGGSETQGATDDSGAATATV
jgi:hypothetical protein